MTERPQVIAIVGPTASGKSSLAERVAVSLGTWVVSVDSMQVYRGMDIGTAKEKPADERCRLLMVDVVDVISDYSVSLFQRDARACVDGLLSKRSVAVLCGGTGLYLDAVIDETSYPSGKVGDDARSGYERFAREHGAEALHELLQGRDAAAAALIHPNNVRRVVRALEMTDRGISYASQNATLKQHDPHYSTQIWGIRMERVRLYRRIDERVDIMFAKGLVDEVRALMERGLMESTTASQAIGYKEVAQYLQGRCSLDDAIDEVKKRTRRYAKRQLSWLKRDGRTRWIDYDLMSEDEALGIILDAYEGGC